MSSTQDAQLPAPLVAKLLYFLEKPIPTFDEQEEHAPEPTKEDLDKYFEVFYQKDPKDHPAPSYRHSTTASISISQEAPDIPKAMVQEEKTLDLLALLTAHAGGNTPTVLVVPQPLTPAPTRVPFDDATEKKRKRGKGSEGTEEGEITLLAQ